MVFGLIEVLTRKYDILKSSKTLFSNRTDHYTCEAQFVS